MTTLTEREFYHDMINASPNRSKINDVMQNSWVFEYDYTRTPGENRNRAWELVRSIQRRMESGLRYGVDPYCSHCGEELRYCTCC